MGKVVVVPLPEQIAELKREMGMRSRVYPVFVRRGKLTLEASIQQQNAMAAAIRTLELMAQFPDAVRATIKRELELADIKQDPAVKAVIEVFPDSTVSVRDVTARDLILSQNGHAP
jgi:hypothetical protein